MNGLELRFDIRAYSPETIPMERLGKYLAALGAMLGEAQAVHFVKLEKGSTRIVHCVELEAIEEVETHIASVRLKTADVVHLNAYNAINDLLKEDNTTGALVRVDTEAEILPFPGRLLPTPRGPEFVLQPGAIDGVLISLGGRDDTVPVRIQSGATIYRCTTTREIAKHLGSHLYGAELRLSGEGKWARSSEGVWTLDLFKIFSFETLDDAPLYEVIADLRSIRGEWSTTEDPWAELQELRNGEDD